MFPNLRAEMARLGLTYKDLADAINKSPQWVESRLLGKTVLPVADAILIKTMFFKDLSYEYLYSDYPITHQ